MKPFLCTLVIMFIFCNTSKAMRESTPTPELFYHTEGGSEVKKKVTEVDVSALESMSSMSINQLRSFCQIVLSFENSCIKPILITSKSQFLQIGKEQAKNIKSIVFKGIKIDEDFFAHYCEIMTGEYSKIGFVNCTTDGVNFADVLDGSNVIDLTITGCNLALDDLSEVLLRINAYAIKEIDISSNDLGTAGELVRGILINRICNRMCLDKLILSDNNLDSEIITDITTLCCNKK